MAYESNVEILKEYGLKHGVKEEDLDDYVRRIVIGMAGN